MHLTFAGHFFCFCMKANCVTLYTNTQTRLSSSQEVTGIPQHFVQIVHPCGTILVQNREYEKTSCNIVVGTPRELDLTTTEGLPGLLLTPQLGETGQFHRRNDLRPALPRAPLWVTGLLPASCNLKACAAHCGCSGLNNRGNPSTTTSSLVSNWSTSRSRTKTLVRTLPKTPRLFNSCCPN